MKSYVIHTPANTPARKATRRRFKNEKVLRCCVDEGVDGFCSVDVVSSFVSSLTTFLCFNPNACIFNQNLYSVYFDEMGNFIVTSMQVYGTKMKFGLL